MGDSQWTANSNVERIRSAAPIGKTTVNYTASHLPVFIDFRRLVWYFISYSSKNTYAMFIIYYKHNVFLRYSM